MLYVYTHHQSPIHANLGSQYTFHNSTAATSCFISVALWTIFCTCKWEPQIHWNGHSIPHILTHITNFQNGHQVIFQFQFGGSVKHLVVSAKTKKKPPKVFDREKNRTFCIVTNQPFPIIKDKTFKLKLNPKIITEKQNILQRRQILERKNLLCVCVLFLSSQFSSVFQFSIIKINFFLQFEFISLCWRSLLCAPTDKFQFEYKIKIMKKIFV